VQKVEVLPYHTMGAYKWEKLGIPYPLEGVKPPDAEDVSRAERILRGQE
jgi:pyruvate formate lyase activating enzyme